MSRDNQFFQELCAVMPEEGRVLQQEPMKNHTTFKVGGPAKYFVRPKSSEELAEVIALCRERGCAWYILGNGSNLLVGDKGIDGVVISMEEGFSSIRIEGNCVVCGAGALLSRIARTVWEGALTGFEFAAGIPGTLGGAVVMNAGAYGSEIKDVLAWVRVLDAEGKVEVLPASALGLAYRSSIFQENGMVVLEAGLLLEKGNREESRKRMEELAAARREKQPLEYPSAGSMFKRPQGYFAGKLIQDAGLRGKQIGGAQVSEKHCGFVINRDNASAQDIRELCAYVAGEVERQFGVKLELEVKVLGEWF